MSPMLMIGFILVAAFLLQGVLGFFQIRNFAHQYRLLRQQGKVLIGKNPRKIQAGSLILMAIDQDGNIQSAQLLQGVTVFAHFRPVKALAGQNIAVLVADYTQLHQFKRLTRQCIQNAYKNFIDYRTGHLTTEAFDTHVNIFSLPLVDQVKAQGSQMLGTLKRHFVRG
ncbi:transcriptional regulator GutM [Lactobacillus sp. CBA3605]|uniref:transcriptional regulator GutM n=1 Tax=Lactobacillus sp. CBA3605 TaxID=2099788 RepID=UPI001F1F78E4|nr:transcriptional regulator GutM [Lactobacillus sp. CBA3605]